MHHIADEITMTLEAHENRSAVCPAERISL
jgi:hypothetical protein